MKKILSLILVVIMLLSVCSCGGDNNSTGTTESPKEIEYIAAEKAYTELIEAHNLCVSAMDSIYGAWYFSIYEYDDYYGTSGFNEFCDKANVDPTELINAISDFAGYSVSKSTAYGLFEEFDYSTYFVGIVLKNNGTYEKINGHLASAKESLKSVTNEYSDYTGYSVLKSYYSEIKAYGEFCESPTGSFSQLKTTVDNYETNLRNYKNDLSFIFE
ncbi:MAG: hypothetical protein IJW76_02485 [Clostridia bacterium]|nr:hypothetical protein [Clostridia bacterium]